MGRQLARPQHEVRACRLGLLVPAVDPHAERRLREAAPGRQLERLEDHRDADLGGPGRSNARAGPAPTKQVSGGAGVADRPLVDAAACRVGDGGQERPARLAPPGRREGDMGLDDVAGAQMPRAPRAGRRSGSARSRARGQGRAEALRSRHAPRARLPSRSSTSTPVPVVLDAEHVRAERQPMLEPLRGGDRDRGRAAGDAARQATRRAARAEPASRPSRAATSARSARSSRRSRTSPRPARASRRLPRAAATKPARLIASSAPAAS